MKHTMEDAWYRKKIRGLAQEFFESFSPNITPLFPWVLVYPLPKEEKVRGIWTPDLAGQKMTHKATMHGVVLRIWGTGKGIGRHEEWYVEDGKDVAHVTKTQLALGDVVAFPHWAGWPPDPQHSHDFRMVKEYPTKTSEQFPGGDIIFGKVEFGKESTYNEILDAVAPILREWQMLAL